MPTHRSRRRHKPVVAKVRRPDIQGLRAIAVVAVIADHLFGYPLGGFVGVDVFFVISGFLITGLLLREHETRGTISFRGFYARRIKRVIPAAVLVLVSTLVAAYLLLGKARFISTVWDAVWSLFFVGNWRFAVQGTDYFQKGLPPSPLQHFWSLGVEEQFYVVWPWLMLAILSIGLARFKWSPAAGRRAVGVAIAVITIGSLGWGIFETATNADVAYFSTLSRAWELGIGSLIAVLGSKLSISNRALRTALAWVGLTGIVLSLFVVPAAPGFPAPWALLPVLSTALVIAAGVGGEQPFLWPLTNRVSGYLGEISYSLYLWHFPVLVLLVAVLPSNSPGYFSLALALTGVAAATAYRFLEKPIRDTTWTNRKRGGLSAAGKRGWQTIGLASLVVLTLFVVGSLAVRSAPESEPVVLRAPVDVNGPASVDCFGAAAMDPAAACTPGTSEEVTPTPENGPKDEGNAFDCWVPKGGPMHVCAAGSESPNAISVAVIGDSHAAMLLPGLSTIASAQNWHLDSYVGWACQWANAGRGSACGNAMQTIEKRLLTGPKYDVIVVTASKQQSDNNKSRLAKLYEQAWTPVAARGTKIVVLADNPVVSPATLECVNRLGFSASSACATPYAEAHSEIDPLVAAAKKVPGVSLVDLDSFYCTKTRCPAVIGNVLVYRDAVSHITATFSKTIAPYLARQVSRAANLPDPGMVP